MFKKIFGSLVLGVFVFLSLGHTARAAFSPISISIFPPVQFPPEDYTITGFRASALWGKQRSFYGIDLGLIGNQTTVDFVGIGISGGVNLMQGTTTILGLQLAGLANINTKKATIWGLQIAALANSMDSESSVNGLQFAIANLVHHTTIRGFQVGIYNHARTVYGLQIGLVNRADSIYGLQIGLLNFNGNGPFKVSPLINFGF